MNDVHLLSARAVADAMETQVATGESSGTVKSLAKGLRALDMLMQQDSVGATELARALDMDKGAASRILKTLAESGFAVSGPGRRYQAGPKLRERDLPSGLPNGVSIRERARPLLARLHDLTQESATLAILADDQVLYLDKLDTELMLRVSRPVGTLSPLHCTALGKIFLAMSSTGVPAKLLAGGGREPVSERLLQDDLKATAARGYAIDDEGFALGVRCVAAPLRDGRGRVIAAIGISGPTARISTARLAEFGELTRAVAESFTP